jgi:serine/threonine protein kinase
VTEFVRKETLLDYLRDSPEGKALKLPDLIEMCAQVASGMNYLESIKLVDRDLAARNILVCNNNEVKVADFRLARIIEEEEYVATQREKLPVRWIAPESILFVKFSTKSDVWSFGALLYEVITCGRLPYYGYYYFSELFLEQNFLKILTFFSKREQNREVLVQVSQHKY